MSVCVCVCTCVSVDSSKNMCSMEAFNKPGVYSLQQVRIIPHTGVEEKPALYITDWTEQPKKKKKKEKKVESRRRKEYRMRGRTGEGER